jgi:hypothetical protein
MIPLVRHWVGAKGYIRLAYFKDGVKAIRRQSKVVLGIRSNAMVLRTAVSPTGPGAIAV